MTKDQQYIWHPYTSSPAPIPALEVESAKGVYLQLADGRRVIDAMSSWWAVIHGYNHPEINNAMKRQLDKMSHVMFGGLTHEPAITLSEKLVQLTPAKLQKVFFSDSGSVAVEVALKMALQYAVAKGEPQKSQFLTFRGGYYGDTWHCMSVCDPVTGMHNLFKTNLPQYVFAPKPACRFSDEWQSEYIRPVEKLIAEHKDTLAAVILEPIVQGAGGMWFYHPQYLREIRQLCDENDLLLIADEIATGFGRSGELFACHHAGIEPDIMCLGKALTGGYMSFAATLCSQEIASAISTNPPNGFMHGPTFMGNPLACSAANAAIELLLKKDWKGEIKRIETLLKKHLIPLRNRKSVEDVRVLGAIGVVEMKQAVDMKTIQEQFLQKGVWIRPFGKLVYIMPPYIIQNDELLQITSAMDGIL